MKKTIENIENQPKMSILDAIVTADKMTVEEKEDLIPNFIQKGTLVLKVGRESVGKSTVISQMCAAFSNGTATPFDDAETFEGREPLRVIYIDAEESEDVIAKRFRDLHASNTLATLSKRHPLTAELTTTSPMMKELVAGYKADVLVLSPISAFLPPRCKATSKKDVAQALRPLMDIADEFNCTIIMVQHTNKIEHVDYRKCISDSSYFSEAPRTVVMFGKTGTQGEIFASVEKSSLTSVYEPYQTRIFRFERDRQAVETVGTTSKKWRDYVLQSQGRDVADANKSASAFERKTKMQDTMDAIVKALEGSKALKRDELLNAALDNGGSAGMFERARKQLVSEGIITTQAMRGDGRVTYMVYSLANDEGVEVEDVFDTKGGAA